MLEQVGRFGSVTMIANGTHYLTWGFWEAVDRRLVAILECDWAEKAEADKAGNVPSFNAGDFNYKKK